MRILLAVMIMTIVAVEGIAFQDVLSHMPASSSAETVKLPGRWRVKFNLSGTGEKNLEFDSKDNGAGSFLLLDTGPDNKPEPAAVPATWSQTTNDRVNFSGEAELPYGTCCREIGTLIFKGKFSSSKSIEGKVVFVGSTVDEENIIGFRSLIGTFIATRMTDNR